MVTPSGWTLRSHSPFLPGSFQLLGGTVDRGQQLSLGKIGTKGGIFTMVISPHPSAAESKAASSSYKRDLRALTYLEPGEQETQ